MELVLYEDLVIAVHGKENIDSSRIGRMVGIRKPDRLPGVEDPILELDKESEVWRNEEIESHKFARSLPRQGIYFGQKG